LYKRCSKRVRRKDPAAHRVRILGRALGAARLAARYKVKVTEAVRRYRAKAEHVVGSVAAPMSM
jgi:hypothetical protein